MFKRIWVHTSNFVYFKEICQQSSSLFETNNTASGGGPSQEDEDDDKNKEEENKDNVKGIREQRRRAKIKRKKSRFFCLRASE